MDLFTLLAVFFVLNLIYSAWKMKVLVNPASLFGLGFAIAGIMSMNYYDVWDLDRFRADTFWFMVLGTIFFTFTCVILRPLKREYISKENIENIPISKIYSPVLFTLLLMAIALQMFICYYKYKTMSAEYGGIWGFSELVNMAHMDAREGEELYPWWFNQFNGVSSNIAPFIYLITGVLIAKKELKGKMLYFSIVYLLLTFLDSALGGGKGGAIQGVIMLIIAWFIKYIRVRHKLCIPKKVLVLIGGLGAGVFLGINIMNYAIGRGDEDNSMDVAMYAGAVYCGAELKNMDIFMKRPMDTDVLGQNTFRKFYNMLDKRGLISGYKEKRFEMGALKPFLKVNGYNLGNVYTLFCDLYWDFRWLGLIFMPIMGLILMYFYKKVFTSKKPVAQVSIWEFFYLNMAWHTFMSFFSNRFFEAYCNPMTVIKSIIYFCIFDYILRRWVYLKTRKRVQKLPSPVIESKEVSVA